MSHGGVLRANIQTVNPLRVEEDKSGIILGETLGNYGSLGQTLLSDVEDLSTATLSRQVAGAPDICHDRGWAYAFKVNVIITILAAICFGSKALEAIPSDQQIGELGWRRLYGTSDTFAWVSFLFVGLGLVALGGGLALGILHCLINCGKPIIRTLMILVTLSWLSAIVRLAVGGNIFKAALVAFFFYAVMRFFHRRRARFHFGAANCSFSPIQHSALRVMPWKNDRSFYQDRHTQREACSIYVAAIAIKSMPGTIFTSLLMSGVQLLWVLVSLAAALGSNAHLEMVKGYDGSMHRGIHCEFRNDRLQEGCFCRDELASLGTCEVMGFGFPLMLFWLVTTGWGCLVIQNVVTSTVSGSVAAWWFSRNGIDPVKGALYRAVHSSFGTLCKAAAIVTAVRVFFVVLRRALRRVPAPCRSCLGWLFDFAEDALLYFLSYAVTFVGIYGLDLDSAVRRVREVFTKKGLTPVRNDIVVDLAIGFLAFSASLLFWAISRIVLLELYAVNMVWSFQLVALLFFGFKAFWVMTATVLEVMRAAVKAVFVCFVQDPEALKVTHGTELYNELTAAWVKVDPEDSRQEFRYSLTPCARRCFPRLTTRRDACLDVAA